MELRHRALDSPRVRETHKVMCARDRANEVAVRHVCERREVGLVVVPGTFITLVQALAGRHLFDHDVGRAFAYLASCSYPVPQLFGMWFATQEDGAADLFKGPFVFALVLFPPLGFDLGGAVGGWWGEVFGHGDEVFDFLGAAAVFFHEGEGGGEDGAALLAGLDGACDEALAVSDALDVVEDGY